MKKSRFQKAVASLLSFTFAFMVFSFSFAPKAYAAGSDANIDITYGVNRYWYGTPTYLTINATTPVVNGSFSPVFYTGSQNSDFRFNTDPTILFGDVVKLYVSYYFAGSSRNTVTPVGNYLDKSTWEVSYINQYNQEGEVLGGLHSYEQYSNSASLDGYVYALEAQWQGSVNNNIRALNVQRVSENNGFSIYCAGSAYALNLIVPSIRIITTEVTAEMEALDNVASEIAAQSDILLAMKGDIVAILQDIYTMTGDMHIAQNLLNSYIEQLLPLIQNIDQTTTNIYALLSSQLAALETAINTSASTIEAAIEAQTAAMIAFLEEMFNTGNEVPDETYQQQQDAENILDQMESLEKPDVETIVPEIDDYSDGGVSGVMSAIFSSNLIVTMMTLSASLAFGAYVLFGKRS